MTPEEARKILFDEVEKDARNDMARIIRQIEAEAREEGEKRARNLIADAIQRVASEHVSEVTSAVVTLPNEEMKRGHGVMAQCQKLTHIILIRNIKLIMSTTHAGAWTIQSMCASRIHEHSISNCGERINFSFCISDFVPRNPHHRSSD